VEKAVSEVNGSDIRKTDIVKLKALDVFAGCGGMGIVADLFISLAVYWQHFYCQC